MNSRSVNEKSLVNYSVDLSTLNPLDSKDGLLSFPFDHLYACHSDNADRRQTIQLDKELEIATHCVVGESSPKEVVVSSGAEVGRLAARLTASENQNKKLKELLVYHLDLIQQQNDHFTKKEKVYQALKQENESLKSRLTRMDRRVAISQRHSVNPPPLVHVPPTNVTSTIVKTEPGQQQLILNSYTELLLPSDSRSNSFIFDSDINKTKTFGQDAFELTRTADAGVANYLTGELSTAVLDNNINCENFTMIESKRSLVKKEIKTENRADAVYTVTSNSGNPVIQRIQRNRRRPSTGMGTVSRASKGPAIKLEPPESSKTFEDDKPFERTLNVNKKSKMINTYGKSRSNAKRTTQLTGSLSDRLQLIDTTPTGEDPYQLGEADMREQSPIPKLMLQKTNHGRMKICTDTVEAAQTAAADTKNKIKLDRYNLSTAYVHGADVKLEAPKTILVDEPDLDIVKTEAEIDWQVYDTEKAGNETSLCDFSYGENANNIASHILPPLDAIEFQELFANDTTLTLHNYQTEDAFDATTEKTTTNDKSKRRNVRTTSLVGTNVTVEEPTDSKRGVDCKRGRKRALSTTGLAKNIKRETAPKLPAKPKLIKGKAASRGTKSPLPGMVVSKPYHTLVGDPDLTWYLGLDPDVKMEDIDRDTDTQISTVEVPRWREKPYTSCYTMEGTENLDDKVFEKRHQKLEAEERRQLRWHMRRIREQRHVERLRQRQRDPWAGGGGASGGAGGGGNNPPAYTVWPQPQRDVRFIEITDALPVTAFGEILPALPDSDFVLPWVRISKALKRSKRSKTLH